MFFVGCVIETVGADSTSALGSQHLSSGSGRQRCVAVWGPAYHSHVTLIPEKENHAV